MSLPLKLAWKALTAFFLFSLICSKAARQIKDRYGIKPPFLFVLILKSEMKFKNSFLLESHWLK